MRHAARRMKAAAAGLIAILGASGALAITDEEVYRTFRFNFINPGGRAGAMGGAFIGIADDATAAAANPAGLTNLISPEFFVELRLQDNDPVQIEALVDDPRGFPDPLLTASRGESENILSPSFISVVKPFEHWVIGFSRQEVLNERSSTANVFTNPKAPAAGIILASEGELEVLVENYNLSLGFKGGKWFAAGVSATWSRLSLEARNENYFDTGTGLTPDYATEVDDKNEDLTWSAGFLFKPHDKIHLGLVYRDGASFDVEESIRDTAPPGRYPSAGVLADFLGNQNIAFDPFAPFGLSPNMFDDPLSFNNHFEVPDQYGIGFGIRPVQQFTIAIDAVQVEYSDLEHGFVGNVNDLTFPGDAPNCDLANPNPDGTFPCEYTTPVATYELADALIWHLGLEYVWTLNEKVPFALRGGVYNDPNTRLDAKYPPGGVFIADDQTFPKGDEDLHYTLGVGFVLQDKFQADFAADFSKPAKSFVASFIYHF